MPEDCICQINLITNSFVKIAYSKEGSDSLGTPAQSIMKAVWNQEVVEFLSLKLSVRQSVQNFDNACTEIDKFIA